MNFNIIIEKPNQFFKHFPLSPHIENFRFYLYHFSKKSGGIILFFLEKYFKKMEGKENIIFFINFFL